MVNIPKETLAFLKEYHCSLLQARNSALLSKALLENECAEIIALNRVLRRRGLNVHSTAVLCIQISALAIWMFTNYRPIEIQSPRKHTPQKHTSTTNANIPNLARDIYPLTSMVLGLPQDNITVQMRVFAQKHARGKFTPKQLIFSVLDEAMKTSK